MNTNYCFMAFASGKESVEGSGVKRYTGIAPVNVLAVNPTKEELEKIYNTQLENAPEYLSEIEAGEDKHKVKSARIDFIVQTDAARCNGIDFITKITFFLRNEPRYNRDKTKVQVIDKYGRTAWPTVEEAKAYSTTLTKADGSTYEANIDKDYRPAYVGEEELTNFIRTYLRIPNVMEYVKGSWVMTQNPQFCEARLDGIAQYFIGNFSELNSVIALQPKNKVKVLFGVRTSDDNKQYQVAYTRKFLPNNATDYSKLDADVQSSKNAGAYGTTEFFVGDLKEYVVEPTNFDTAADDLPFQTGSAPSPWDNL